MLKFWRWMFLSLALWTGVLAQQGQVQDSRVSVSIPSVLYLKTPPGVPLGNQGEKASELFLPAGEWVLEVVANGRWRLEVHGAFLGVRVRQAPGQAGEVVLIPPHPGASQDGGPGKAFPEPSDGTAYAKEAAEKSITGSPGPLLVAEGRGRGRVVLELSSCSPTCRVVVLP